MQLSSDSLKKSEQKITNFFIACHALATVLGSAGIVMIQYHEPTAAVLGGCAAATLAAGTGSGLYACGLGIKDYVVERIIARTAQRGHSR